MSIYRRNYVPGGTYFFTVVTYRRRQFLTDKLARACLHEAIETSRLKRLTRLDFSPGSINLRHSFPFE